MPDATPPARTIIPLFGHEELRERLLRAVRAGSLPQSLLLHGPQGVGKQRLALLVAQALLCREPEPPCGACKHCRYVIGLVHPDLTWIFPRPRPKDSDLAIDDVKSDLATAALERAEAHGLYAAPPGSEGIYVATVRHVLRRAALTPALAARKVFVIGDADRMVPVEGQEFAANALLKLLEEPLADTWIIATSSAVGALLPTIRSRVVTVRVPRLPEAAMRAFLRNPAVSAALDKLGVPKPERVRLDLAEGAPGVLLSSGVRQPAVDEAKRLLDAAVAGRRSELWRLAFLQGHRGARGAFSDLLDALTLALRERMRGGAEHGNARQALAASQAIDLVEDAKLLADGNVSPQLITADLLRHLAATLA